jgi:hypothetical protein
MHRKLPVTIGLIVMVTLLIAQPSAAVHPPEPGVWQHDLVIYGWLPWMGGTMGYGVQGAEKPFTLDPGDILGALNMTAQVGFEAQRSGWSVIVDIIYMDMGDGKSATATLPDGSPLTAKLNVDLNAWIMDFNGAYTVARTDRANLQGLFGVRYLSMDSDLKLDLSAPILPTDSFKAGSDVLDIVVGARGNVFLSGPWTIPYRADVGAGGSDLTWQLMGGIDYAWSWGGAMLAWRYMGYEEGKTKLLHDLSINGPALGIRFHF